MSEDIIRARSPLRLYVPAPDFIGFLKRRKVAVALCYAAYVILVFAAAAAFEALPPEYEVSAMIDLQPGSSYGLGDEQRIRDPRPEEIARSQVSLLTTESVIRGALADVGSAPKMTPRPEAPLRAVPAPVPPSEIPVAASMGSPSEQPESPRQLATAPAAEPMRSVVETAAPIMAARQLAAAANTVYGAAVPVVERAYDGLWSLSDETARWLVATKNRILPPLPAADEAYVEAKKSIRTQAEPNTSFIRVSYESRHPAYAVKFLNALIQRFTEKHYDLYSNAGAISFFAKHRQESEDEFSRASAALADFSARNNIFSIEEQRKLLLQERGQASADLAATRNLQAQKEGEAAIIGDQLVQMKPFSQYPQIGAIAQSSRSLRQSDPDPSPAPVPERSPRIPSLAGDPPLLLVKVYQDTIASLVKLNTEIAGLRAKLQYQELQLTGVDRKLADLSAKESTFDRLRQKVELARTTAAQFARKAVDEQIQQDLKAQKLSSVRIVQPPTPPVEPMWPPRLVLGLALLLAVLPGAAMSGPAIYRAFGRS